MESKCFVICDSEKEYATRLSALLSRKIEYPIYLCSSFDAVKKLAKERVIGILLIEETLLQEDHLQDVEDVFILVHEEREQEQKKKIFKYQSADGILSEILTFCIEHHRHGILKCQRYKNCTFIGIYSPIHRTGQTTFALALGKEAAKGERVLYLNLETYSGWEERIGKKEKYTLGDLLYYARQEKGNLEERLGIMTGDLEGLEYIAPMAMSEDLKAVTLEEWKELFVLLQRRKIYKKIIIDFGESVQGLWELLELCSQVYMPICKDEIAYAKVTQFEKNADILGHSKLREQICKVELGDDVEKAVEQVMRRKEWKHDRTRKTS